MSIDINQPSQLYKITHLPSNKIYIGITWGKNHSYKKRFKIHMSGKGGVYIKKLLDSGYTEYDFKIELIEENTLDVLYDMECELSVLYPVGLNGNKGHAIIQSTSGTIKAQEKRNKKMDEICIKKAMRLDKSLTKDEAIKRRNRKKEQKKWWNSLTEKEQNDIKKERKINAIKKISEIYNNKSQDEKDKIIKKRNRTVNNKSQDEKDNIYKKVSKTLQTTLLALSTQQMKKRMYNSCLNLTEEQKIARGNKISASKKGKKTNQQQITEKRYKNMSDKEFEKVCEGMHERYINRAKNLRNR